MRYLSQASECMDAVLDIVKDYADVSDHFPSFSVSLNLPCQVYPIAKATINALKVTCGVCLFKTHLLSYEIADI